MAEHSTIPAPAPAPAPRQAEVETMPQTELPQPDLYMEGLMRLPLQRKLSMGAADDPSEKEADATADKVMRMPETPFLQHADVSRGTETLQRKLEGPDEEEERVTSDWTDREDRSSRMPLPYGEEQDEEQIRRKPLASFIQRKVAEAGSAVVGDTAAVGNTAAVSNTVAISDTAASQIQSSRGGGSPLPSPTRSFMESRFGADFSPVRVHADNSAAQLSEQLNARAFTVGRDIYFNRDKFSPDSADGRHLLAHELTHTIQQGAVDGAASAIDGVAGIDERAAGSAGAAETTGEMVQASPRDDKAATTKNYAADEPGQDLLDPDDNASRLISYSDTMEKVVSDARSLAQATNKKGGPYKSLFVFTQSGLTIYSADGSRIIKSFAQRKEETMLGEGAYWIGGEDASIFAWHFTEKKRFFIYAMDHLISLDSFSEHRKAEILKRKGMISIGDFVTAEPGDIKKLDVFPALGLSRVLPVGTGKGKGDGGGGGGGNGGDGSGGNGGAKPEDWAVDQAKAVKERQGMGKNAPNTLPSERDPKADQKKPDRIVVWARHSDGAQFVNVWVNKDHKTLKLDEDEKTEKLQQRIEEATKELRGKQVDKALKDEQDQTKGNIPYNDSTYLGGTNTDGPRPNREAWRADVTGPDVMTREGKSAYTMTLHYEDENRLSPIGQVVEAITGAEISWQIIDITPLYQQIMKERAAKIKEALENRKKNPAADKLEPTVNDKALDANVTALDAIGRKDKLSEHQSVTAMDGVRNSALWRSRHLDEDVKQAENDLLHPFDSQDGSTGSAIKSVLVNSFNLATADLHAVLSAGGLLVEAIAAIFEPHDHYEREISFPDHDGYFLVRSVAQPRPRGTDEHPVIRVPSVAVKVVEVKEIKERTNEELDAQDVNLQAMIEEMLLNYQYATDPAQVAALRETLEWKVQEAAQSNHQFLETKIVELQKRAVQEGLKPEILERVKQEIEILQRGTKAGSGLISDILSHQITLKNLELEKAEKEGNRLAANRLEKEIDQLRSRLSTATEREREMVVGDQPIVRPQAIFVNEETGQTIPLLIELGQDEKWSSNNGYSMRLSDLGSTSSDEYSSFGKTRGEAVRNVIKKYAGHFPYGRGYMTVRIPDGTNYGITDTIMERCNPRDTAQASERLDELLEILAVLGLFVPGVGTAVAIVGAVVAAAHILNRLDNHTFEWDTATVMDILNIVGAVASGVSHVAGARLVVAKNMFAIVPESEELEAWVARLNRFARIVDFVDSTVNDVSYVLGMMNTIDGYADIEEAVLSGSMSRAEARRAKASLMTHAMYDQVMQHGAHLAGHFAGDGTRVNHGEERAPMEHPDALSPVTHGITEDPNRAADPRPAGDEQEKGAPAGHPDGKLASDLNNLPKERSTGQEQPTIGSLLPDTAGLKSIEHVPVTRPDGLTGNETLVKFENGRVVLELGPNAGPRELRNHLGTMKTLARFEGALGYVRQLISRAGDFLGFGPGFGTRGFEARLEVDKLTGIYEGLTGLRDRLESEMDRISTVSDLVKLGKEYNALEREISEINKQIAEHARDINSREDARGQVAMKNTLVKPIVKGDPRFGKQLRIGERIVYADKGGTIGIATGLPHDQVMIVTRLGQRTIRDSYNSLVDRAGLPSGRNGFEILHAIGPIVGHESPFGMAAGSWTINQKRQRLGVERLINAFGSNILKGKDLELRVLVEPVMHEVLPAGGSIISTGEILPPGTILSHDGTILRGGQPEEVEGDTKEVDFLKEITYGVYGIDKGRGDRLFELSFEAVDPTDPLTRIAVGSSETKGKILGADEDVTNYDGIIYLSDHLSRFVDGPKTMDMIGVALQASEPREEAGLAR